MATIGLTGTSIACQHRLDDEEAADRVEELVEELADDILRDHRLHHSWDGRRQRLSLDFKPREGKTRVSGEVRVRGGSVKLTLRGEIHVEGPKGRLKGEASVRSILRHEAERVLRDVLGKRPPNDPTEKLWKKVLEPVEERVEREVARST